MKKIITVMCTCLLFGSLIQVSAISDTIKMSDEEINQLRNSSTPSQTTTVTYQREASPASLAHFLRRISGDWYDYDGNLVLTIEDGYLNGCQIVTGFDLAGGYPEGGVIRITEATGNRDIRINAFGEVPHKYVVLNGNTPLRQTTTPQHFESIDGIYLGMTPSEVIGIYGEPIQIITRQGINTSRSVYDYPYKGVKVYFDNGVAANIIFYGNGSAHLDRTGYKCTNSLNEYYNKYKLARMPTVPSGEYTSTGSYRIAPGEYLFFDAYPTSIMLSLYSN